MEVLKLNKKLMSLNLSFNTIFEGKAEQALADSMCHFIKRNRYLTHLNLTATNINAVCLLKIGKALRRSCSLQSIHLCENPGINEETITQIRDVIHGKDQDEPIKISPKVKDLMHYEVG
jgi:hypothetical protein